MKEEHKYLISVLKDEIQKAFNNFDANIENGQHSVPIQTLDYWAMKLEQLLRETKDQSLPTEHPLLFFHNTRGEYNSKGWAFCVLSDVQHLIGMGRTETAIERINDAKRILKGQWRTDEDGFGIEHGKHIPRGTSE